MVIVLAALTMALAGCTAAAPSPGSSTTRTTAPGSGLTTTTTTLPVPVALQGTSVPGDAFLGIVRRVPVVAVPAGRPSAAFPLPGTPPYLLIQQVAYRQFGSGPDLLLVMGQDGSMSWWEPSLLAVLAQHYRVTVFDLPGVGYSSPALVPMTLDWLADETAGLVQALGLVNTVVLGWGLGGAVALALAERHPASETSLVLVDSSIGGPDAVQPAAAVQAALDAPTATASSLATTLFGAAPSSSTAGATSAESLWLSALDANVPDNLTQRALDEEREVQLSLWSSTALSTGVGSVVVPTLVAYGDDDAVFPAPDGLLLRRAIAGSERDVLPGAGYAAMYEDSSRFVADLEQFTG
ncbi:MAG: alpha/beta hydrolase [Acidimicrobiales bacterium]